MRPKTKTAFPAVAEMDVIMERQCQTMHSRARAWRKANPQKQPLIQWNFQKPVIGCISDALAAHFVSANADGLELIKALWAWNVPDEPTILMVRIVLERDMDDGKSFVDEMKAHYQK